MAERKPETVVVPLSYPFTYEEKLEDGKTKPVEVTEIILHRLKGGHLRKAAKEHGISLAALKNDAEEVLALICVSSGLPLDLIDQIDVDDVAKLTEVLVTFFPQVPEQVVGSRRTGRR